MPSTLSKKASVSSTFDNIECLSWLFVDEDIQPTYEVNICKEGGMGGGVFTSHAGLENQISPQKYNKLSKFT